MSKRALSTVATRHQVYLERLKTQFSADFTRVLPELEKAIRDVLRGRPCNGLGITARRGHEPVLEVGFLRATDLRDELLDRASLAPSPLHCGLYASGMTCAPRIYERLEQGTRRAEWLLEHGGEDLLGAELVHTPRLAGGLHRCAQRPRLEPVLILGKSA